MAAKSIPCPICRKRVPHDHPEMPFCSERCRMQDLMNWSDEKYRVPVGSRPTELEDQNPDQDYDE